MLVLVVLVVIIQAVVHAGASGHAVQQVWRKHGKMWESMGSCEEV